MCLSQSGAHLHVYLVPLSLVIRDSSFADQNLFRSPQWDDDEEAIVSEAPLRETDTTVAATTPDSVTSAALARHQSLALVPAASRHRHSDQLRRCLSGSSPRPMSVFTFWTWWRIVHAWTHATGISVMVNSSSAPCHRRIIPCVRVYHSRKWLDLLCLCEVFSVRLYALLISFLTLSWRNEFQKIDGRCKQDTHSQDAFVQYSLITARTAQSMRLAQDKRDLHVHLCAPK